MKQGDAICENGIKIVKSEDGKLCGVGRMPRHLRT